MTDAQHAAWDALEARYTGTRFTLLNGPVADDGPALIEADDLNGHDVLVIEPDGRWRRFAEPPTNGGSSP